MVLRKSLFLLPALFVAWGLMAAGSLQGESESRFSKATIDFGIVVSDIDASAAFYRDALGFREVPGFEVPGAFCASAGLTDSHPLAVRVFVLGEGELATRVKLMELEGVKSKRSDNAFIHSQLGFSYLTVYVRDMDASLALAKAAGVVPLAEGPVQIGEAPGPLLSLVRDPDGNLIELLGPRP